MPGYSDPSFDTLSVHAGATAPPCTSARALPMHMGSTAVFEQRIAALEVGVGALATASGQAALHLSIATLMDAGSHIVASSTINGNSHHLLHYTLRRFGLQTTFVAPGDLKAWQQAIRPNTCLLFGQTVGDLSLEVMDIPAVAELAQQAKVPLLVDSSLTTPYLIQPLSLGADMVLHGATTFLSGHSTVLGGAIVDGGSFDWANAPHCPAMNEPYAGSHNRVFSEEASVGAFLLRARCEGLPDFGACLSPHCAWLILQGMETLSLRMRQHLANTEKVVEFLTQHPLVAQVQHPLLEHHPSYHLAQQLLPKGVAAVVGFALKGGYAQGMACVDALRIISHQAHIGASRSGVTHPASSSHFGMNEAALLQAGIQPGTMRLSIGLEDADDLIDDLKRAFKAAQKAGA